MEKTVRGLCEEYCPENEKKIRIKERLLNFYELKNGQKDVPGVIVKSFSRSAAGIKLPSARDLRTDNCLQRTIEYLFKNILFDKRRPYNFAYDFVFDRLRAIRQELIIQKFNVHQTVRLLEPMIMFLAYSRYNLCEESIDIFDAKICEQHLQECLKRVLCCYDEIDAQSKKSIDLKKRVHIECIYQIFNAGSIEALYRALNLPTNIRQNTNFHLVFSLSLHYFRGHYYRVLKIIKQLPHIQCAIASIKLPNMRCKLLSIFVLSYHSKQSVVPKEFLCRCMLYDNTKDLTDDCCFYGLRALNDNVILNKNDMSKEHVMKGRKEDFVKRKFLDINVTELLLLNHI